MKIITLRQKILHAFFAVIFVLAGFAAILRFFVIKKDIIQQAQEEVSNALSAARSVYDEQLKAMRTSFNLVSGKNNLAQLRNKIGLDYLYSISLKDKDNLTSEIAQAAFLGKEISGTRIISKDELLKMGELYYRRAAMRVLNTPKAEPTKRKILENAMAMECALPLHDSKGAVSGVLYGGKIINRDFTLVDKIRDLVFAQKGKSEKSTVTVTIFQDDVRISTNVLTKSNRRAIGTRVSSAVFDTVIKNGQRWIDRAFVVNDWYLTAYEPIRGINGEIIGILYVGILEKPFKDLEHRFYFGVLLSLVLAVALAILFSYILTAIITRPMGKVLQAIEKVSQGETEHRVDFKCSITELNTLLSSFNDMADKLHEREKWLKVTNEKLMVLNKNYIDMVGFVSHELKGLLGSIVMNIYSVKDGYLGELNEKQKKAIDAAAKSLDHFESVVKNYLNLSKIEEGKLDINRTEIDFADDVLKNVLEHFEKERFQKGMVVDSNVCGGLKIIADKNLLTIVCNNLIGNALKYGAPSGKIIIDTFFDGQRLRVGIYNDGTPIKMEEKDNLFKRFSRLSSAYSIKGTGLGLFIAREIIEKHGGEIWVEPKETGNAFIFTLPQNTI